MNGQIHELAPGEVIEAPGFYRMSLERHHNQPCAGVSVTSGVLRTLWSRTPLDVWAFHKLNPNRWERRETPALRIGRAMAAIVEGGEEALREHFAVLPEDKPRKPSAQQVAAYNEGRATEIGKASVEFWRGVAEDHRDFVSDAEWRMLIAMGGVLASDPAAQTVMGGEPEVTMAWRDEATGLWILSRPDTVSFSGMMSDYKRMATEGRAFDARTVDQRITQHGYDMQMALAEESFERLTGHRPDSVGIIAQWADPPHHVILREIALDDLEIARRMNRIAIDRFAECLESGYWPGPGEEVGAYSRPQWQREQIQSLLGLPGGKDE